MTRNFRQRKSVSPELVKKILVYSLLSLLLASLQCSFFARLSICPATPDLMLGLVAAIALLDSREAAAICGIGCGVLIDALGASTAFSPLLYFVAACILGGLSEKMLQKLPSFLTLMLPALLMRAVWTAGCVVWKLRRLPPVKALLVLLLKEAAVTLVLCLPIWFLARLAIRICGTRKHFDL